MQRRQPRWPREQRGAALIALAAVLVLGTSWITVSALGGLQGQRATQVARDGAVLREAKDALIAYVASQAFLPAENSPGRLPCPEDPAFTSDGDSENDGVAAATCTLPAVGRLPWRTLGVPKLVDHTGEPLWYVVSTGWAIPTGFTAVSLNSNTLGQLTVDGAAPATPTTSNTVAALIIAPGPPLTVSPTAGQIAAGCASRTQNRGTMPPDLRDYLECENATSPANATFVSAVVENVANPVLNDRVVTISPAEIFDKAEAAIAARIERDVVPQLKTAYNTSQWNASTTNPVYPFATPFGNPSTSTFQGAAGTRQGLLPVTYSNCTAGSDPRCDPAFVKWKTDSPFVDITVTKSSGTATMASYDCSASTASQLSCTVFYQRTGCLLFCTATLIIDVTAIAQNIGNSMRKFPTSNTSISGFTTRPALPTSLTIATNGSVTPTFTGGRLPTLTCLFSCWGNATFTIPITLFGDHDFLSPATGDAWWWFFNSNWHHLVYYAVAQGHAPSGAMASCTSSPLTCLSITNVTPTSSQRAVLVLAGRTLTGSSRPNGTLSDFLDDVAVSGVAADINRDSDPNFSHKAGTGPTFNDRFIVVDSN